MNVPSRLEEIAKRIKDCERLNRIKQCEILEEVCQELERCARWLRSDGIGTIPKDRPKK